jgi:predicted nucleotidyltransferase
MAPEHDTIHKTPSANNPVLAEVVRRLVEVYRPERVCLSGSVARGKAGPDSDYDITVVVPDTAPDWLGSEDPGYGVLRGTGAGADILVWTRGDFERQLHWKASFPPALSGKVF